MFKYALVLLLCTPLPSRAHISSTDAQPPFNSTWLSSYQAKVNLTSTAGVLRWDKPEHFSTIFTYLPRPL